MYAANQSYTVLYIYTHIIFCKETLFDIKIKKSMTKLTDIRRMGNKFNCEV